MKLLIKFLIASCIPCILPSVTFAEKLNNRSIPSALMEIRKPIIGQFYSCRYEISYTNLEEQKKFENDQTAKKTCHLFISNLLVSFTNTKKIQSYKHLKT